MRVPVCKNEDNDIYLPLSEEMWKLIKIICVKGFEPEKHYIKCKGNNVYIKDWGEKEDLSDTEIYQFTKET